MFHWNTVPIVFRFNSKLIILNAQYPRPGCIQKNSVIKSISLDCSSECTSTESIESCSEYNIGKVLLEKDIISVEELKLILQEQVYDKSGKDPSNDEWNRQLDTDFKTYDEFQCQSSCSNDINCIVDSRQAKEPFEDENVEKIDPSLKSEFSGCLFDHKF